jgi:hypothetical protein
MKEKSSRSFLGKYLDISKFKISNKLKVVSFSLIIFIQVNLIQRVQ